MKTILILASLAVAAPVVKKAAVPSSTTSGKVVKAAAGRLLITDDAGHPEEFLVTPKTKVTCDGKKAAFGKTAAGTCGRAKVVYDAQTKKVSILELKTVKDADDAGARPAVSGEVALTDVLNRRVSVRLGGGATLDFKVDDDAKVLRETPGESPQAVEFETLKVGDAVEIVSKDWKTAQEIHVRASAR